jgi:hypothetical protein
MSSLRSVGFAANENEADLPWLRARLRRMSDAELLRGPSNTENYSISVITTLSSLISL